MIRLSQLSYLALAAALALGGCVMADSSQRNIDGVGPDAGAAGDDEDEFDRDDCKIEDGDIGIDGASIELGDFSVTFTDWVQKDGEPGEYVGFTIDAADGEVAYRVKAGGDVFESDAATWSHPNGTGGPDVSAISHVDVCDEDGNPPGGGDDDGSGDDGSGDDGGGDDGSGDDGSGDDGSGDDGGDDDGSGDDGGSDDGSGDDGGDDGGGDDGGGDDGGDDDIIID